MIRVLRLRKGYTRCDIWVGEMRSPLLLVLVDHRMPDDYAECSAMKNRGVNEAFTEAARVALKVAPSKKDSRSLKDRCTVM